MAQADSPTTPQNRWIVHAALIAYAITVALLFVLSTLDWRPAGNSKAVENPTAQHRGVALAVSADASKGLLLRLTGASKTALAGAESEHAVLQDAGDFDRLAALSIGDRFRLQLAGHAPTEVSLVDWPLRFSGALFLTIVATDRDDVRPFLLQVNRKADFGLPPMAGLVGDFRPPSQ